MILAHHGPVLPTGPRLSALAPARRRLLLAVLAVLVVAAAALTAVVLRGGGADAKPVPQDVPGPVIVVPGYGGSTRGPDELAGVLRRLGKDVTVLALPGTGTGDLDHQAAALQAAAKAVRTRTGAPSVDVIGYSAGGVVARLWVEEHDGRHKARRVVTLGSPQHGAQIAAAGAAALPGACPVACQQLAPGSQLLGSLSESVPTPPEWMSVWTENDETVTPADSARLDGATNVDIQQACPGRQVSHGDLPSDDYVTSLVLDAIGTGPIGTDATC
jgi:pimeloyl-ACP methyl ester carboxylesterase